MFELVKLVSGRSGICLLSILLILTTFASSFELNPTVDEADSALREEIDAGAQLRSRRFSAFRAATCRNTAADDGVCHGEVTCKSMSGRVSGFCPGLQGACCVFYRTCGGRTSQRVSHFRNVEWPKDERIRETCSFSITKESPDICGLSVTLEKLDLPGKVGYCSDTFLWISGIPGKKIELICGKYSGITYKLNVTSTTEIYLKIKSYSGYKSSWSMSVRQMFCNEFTDEVLPFRGDGEFPYLVPIAETNKPQVPGSQPISATKIKPKPYFPRCGVKGPEKDSGLSSKASQLEVLSDTIWSSRHANESDDSDEGPDELLRNAEELERDDNSFNPVWDVPELTDSLFHKYSGDPTIVGQRITYGDESNPGEFPWQVALFIGRSFHCGGSIISENHILTAGHCAVRYRYAPSKIRVILGAWNLKNIDKEGAVTHYVKKVKIHEKYSRQTLRNDIAVLTLTKKIEFSRNVRPICLPSKGVDVTGKLAFVTGWGRDQRKRLVSKLHKLQAAVISQDTCDTRWMENGAYKGFIADTMLCMDAQNGDSCNGDSGGPTIVEYPESPGNYYQVGVVSFGSGTCIDKRLPGVYTKVTSYIDWIEEAMS